MPISPDSASSSKLQSLWLKSADLWFNTVCIPCIIILDFLLFFECIVPLNLLEQIWCILHDCRLRAILRGKWQECWVCHKNSSAKFLDPTETLIGHISGGVEVGGIWPQPEKTVNPNGQGQSLGRDTENLTTGTGGTVSLVMSHDSRCFTVMPVFVCVAGKGRDW